MDKKTEFLREWNHFCSRISFKASAMDNEAIIFMNEFQSKLQEVIKEGNIDG